MTCSRAAIRSKPALAAARPRPWSAANRTMRTGIPMCTSVYSWRPSLSVPPIVTPAAAVSRPTSSARPRGRLSMMLPLVVILLELVQPAPLYRESIADTLVSFEMVLVADGLAKPFYIGRTEVTWDMYDVFALGLDRPGDRGGADAIARPSQPYGAPDEGWGHAG